ncbi:MAG: SagB/ThcOx family dehydrogenase [Polyangiaceae bacterium]|nr:SagB/ThcOx family dehydrogenase [Polyangiaceae bacterium]
MRYEPDHPAALFNLFWEGSKLNRRTVRAFAERLEAHDRLPHDPAELVYPQVTALAPASDPLATLSLLRRSERRFGPAPLSTEKLAALFSAFARRPGGRLLPSAGGRYPIEVFALLLAAEAPWQGSIVYYDGAKHGLSRVGSCPDEAIWRELCNLPEGADRPAAVLVFVGFPSRITERYGERGGRFLLLEAGHYAQSLGLRLAFEGLAGYELGGLYDDPVRDLLGLGGTDAIVTLGYAVGHPATP